MDKFTLIRTIVLVVALINQSLVLAGYSPLPFDDAQVENAVTIVFSVVASLLAWWKNNSLTKEAKEADKYLKELKDKK
ncbi:phage holin [Niallia circulans]|uniref:phage holin n=1 Tax=Niallia circulans TaxID=1397 RepID=UPI0026EAC0A6|nr:phage holin [Niallia circulans]